MAVRISSKLSLSATIKYLTSQTSLKKSFMPGQTLSSCPLSLKIQSSLSSMAISLIYTLSPMRRKRKNWMWMKSRLPRRKNKSRKRSSPPIHRRKSTQSSSILTHLTPLSVMSMERILRTSLKTKYQRVSTLDRMKSREIIRLITRTSSS